MNTQKHSAINASPFEVVFGQPSTNGIFPDTKKGVQPHEEDLMNLLEDNHILTDKDDNDSPDEGGEVNVEQPRVSTADGTCKFGNGCNSSPPDNDNDDMEKLVEDTPKLADDDVIDSFDEGHDSAHVVQMDKICMCTVTILKVYRN
jgi:hypothetical protein